MTTSAWARALVLALALVLGGACGGAPAVTPAPPVGAPSAEFEPVPPGSLRLAGALTHPRTIGASGLAAMPQTELSVTYQSSRGPQTRRERGVPLAALLPTDSLAVDPSRKNDLLTLGVLATGADGYRALVSYGEVSPDFADRGLLVSLIEDGAPLNRPRLIVPGDVKGGRYVSDVVELRVVRGSN